jgi:ribosome-binding factor A
MPRDFSRKLRVGAELQRVLNQLLLSGVKDPRLDGVRVSEVEVSGDLGVARVFYAPLRPDDDLDQIEQAFVKAKGFLRSRAGQMLRLRHMPELRFEHDPSAAKGLAMSQLIDASLSHPPAGDNDNGEDDQ